VVDSRCHLPPRAEIVRIAAGLGLIEGGAWCSSDYGHVELPTSRQAEACGATDTFAAQRHRGTTHPLSNSSLYAPEPGALR
jgi:hypothetical protein